jgi:hypothetical protein
MSIIAANGVSSTGTAWKKPGKTNRRKIMAVTRRFGWLFAVFGIMLLTSPKPVFPALFDDEFDAKPWQEIEVGLPAFPEPENLIPFEVGAVRNMRFLIDEKSISVDGDEVVRYSLVVISSSGARNVSFEGMRCLTGERRVYAFGQADKTWSKARNDKWMRIHGGNDSHHVALFSDYFCTVGQRAIMTPEDAVRILRQGGIREGI